MYNVYNFLHNQSAKRTTNHYLYTYITNYACQYIYIYRHQRFFDYRQPHINSMTYHYREKKEENYTVFVLTEKQKKRFFFFNFNFSKRCALVYNCMYTHREMQSSFMNHDELPQIISSFFCFSVFFFFFMATIFIPIFIFYSFDNSICPRYNYIPTYIVFELLGRLIFTI